MLSFEDQIAKGHRGLWIPFLHMKQRMKIEIEYENFLAKVIVSNYGKDHLLMFLMAPLSLNGTSDGNISLPKLLTAHRFSS